MKNSTLLRLFFISIGLPLTYASSPSTSSSLIPESNTASLLVDTTNSAPAVQLKDQGALVQSDHEESQVAGRDEQTKRFEGLINKGQYVDIAKLGEEMSDKELLKCLCQVVTDLDHFRGLYGYLKQRGMVPGFLAHGNMVLVREVIVETDLLEIDDLGRCDSIYGAIALSLKEDSHNRVAGLLEAAQERPAWEYMFRVFVGGFFDRYPPVKNSMPLKRFLTLHGEELSKNHPEIFETICEELVRKLKWGVVNPASQKLMIDFVGQPSLLAPAAFAEVFLRVAGDSARANFIRYGYKEAIEEGLKGVYNERGRKLWAVMVSRHPSQFPGEYPSTDGARAAALKDLPTKQDREEEWAKKNAPMLLKRLETLVTELQLPLYRDLLSIVAGYAITWIVVET